MTLLMITKDEMVERGPCSSWCLACSSCPFGRLSGVIFSKCYTENIEQYKKEKELKLEKKEFTLRDITDAMHSGSRIVHSVWTVTKYIYFDNGMWTKEDGTYMVAVDFSKPASWSHYKEPEKTVKKTYYKAFIKPLNENAGIIEDGWNPSQSVVLENLPIGSYVAKWEEKEFEILSGVKK